MTVTAFPHDIDHIPIPAFGVGREPLPTDSYLIITPNADIEGVVVDTRNCVYGSTQRVAGKVYPNPNGSYRWEGEARCLYTVDNALKQAFGWLWGYTPGDVIQQLPRLIQARWIDEQIYRLGYTEDPPVVWVVKNF